MKLTVLGGSAAGPNTGAGCAGFLVSEDDTAIVIDMGPGTVLELRKHVDFRTLDAIVISHYHLDHILDLGAFRYLAMYDPAPLNGTIRSTYLPAVGRGSPNGPRHSAMRGTIGSSRMFLESENTIQINASKLEASRFGSRDVSSCSCVGDAGLWPGRPRTRIHRGHWPSALANLAEFFAGVSVLISESTEPTETKAPRGAPWPSDTAGSRDVGRERRCFDVDLDPPLGRTRPGPRGLGGPALIQGSGHDRSPWPVGIRVSEPAGRAAFSVGHWTVSARTGCTVALFDRLVPAVVDVRGGAPGTRETDLLSSDRLVGQVDAILLTGGSAFGLAAADGVMRYLRERNRGFQTAAGHVPIVPAAVLFDLGVGSPASPTAESGYAACEAAQPLGESQRGTIGAGTGATIRKLWPDKPPRPGGFGWFTVQATDQVHVHAVCVVNAVGDVAGADWIDERPSLLRDPLGQDDRTSTTLVAVVVDGDADHRTLRRIAMSAHDAMARAIVPCHTLWDGDVVFVAQTGVEGEISQIDSVRLSIAAELAVESAIRSAIPGD